MHEAVLSVLRRQFRPPAASRTLTNLGHHLSSLATSKPTEELSLTNLRRSQSKIDTDPCSASSCDSSQTGERRLILPRCGENERDGFARDAICKSMLSS